MINETTLTLTNHFDFITYRQGSGNTVEIFDIQVGTERGEGKGTRLVQKLVRILKENHPEISLLFAITRENNFIAREFYSSVGFKIISLLPHFYKGENVELEEDSRLNFLEKSPEKNAVMYGLELL
jgi:ribosomal protein S18 acetylase RimI-like enzyme